MTYNPHLDMPVSREGMPFNQAAGAAIAMHGRGRDPEDILQVCRRIGLDKLSWLAPAAHENTWYPQSFMADIVDNEPFLSWTLERIDTLVDEVTGHGIPQDRTVLLGFSQGACAVAEYAVRNARRYGGVILFTGGLIGPPGSQWNYEGDFAGTPAFIGGSDEDDWVPAVRMRETRDVLQSMGARVSEYFYSGREHIVSEEEVDAARDIIAALA
ncbi:MAG: phospholipase [Gammaproteobacteria bacterium]